MLKHTNLILGDNHITVTCNYERPDFPVGWPGSCEVETVELSTPDGKLIDITELIHSVVAQGSEIWNTLAQEAYESILEDR